MEHQHDAESVLAGRSATAVTPDAQGDTTRSVLVTEACRGGVEVSYTVKSMLNLVPMAAAAVFRAHGASPMLAN